MGWMKGRTLTTVKDIVPVSVIDVFCETVILLLHTSTEPDDSHSEKRRSPRLHVTQRHRQKQKL